jgi:hypothetical protein
MNWFVGLLITIGLITWLSILTNNQLKIKTEADKYKGKFSGYEDDYSQYKDDYDQYKQIVTSMCASGIDVPIKKGALLDKHYSIVGDVYAPLEDTTINIPLPTQICTNPIFSSS